MSDASVIAIEIAILGYVVYRRLLEVANQLSRIADVAEELVRMEEK